MEPKPAQAPMAEEGLGRLEQRLRHAAQGGELAHQQEQRHDRQRMAGEGAIGKRLQLVEQRRGAAIDQPGTDQADR
jgi:hypothetical protein